MRLSAAAFRTVLGARLPQYSGRVRVSCRRPIEIRRDLLGVAYIEAESEFDAWFGLGFAHAQDRAGQMELSLRSVRGTVAAVVGPEGLVVDRVSRLIGFHRAAAAQIKLMDADIVEELEAYCAGVNASLTSSATPRSHEHALLRCEPSVWTPADVIGLGLLICCMLPSNWDVELARLITWAEDGEDAVRALEPTYPPGFPLTSPPGGNALPIVEPFLARDLLRFREVFGPAGGSNAWAVGGQKTQSGRPLLANDPHLPAALPNLGYLARVKCPSFGVAGVSLIGFPAFISGHNGRGAWGTTAAHVDNTDLFLEELSADGQSYRQGDSFVPCERRLEWIDVKGQGALGLTVLSTPRGPIVARADDPEGAILRPLPSVGQANALSFAATWLRQAPTRSLLGLHRAQSFSAFRQICSQSTGCSYSVIYADPDTIGWVLATEAPRRGAGNGSLPQPGWLEGAGWGEVATSDQLPWLENPTTGFVCCANNQPVDAEQSPVFLGHDFLDGYRQRRIAEELAAKSDWNLELTAALQLDVLSLPWRELRDTVLALDPGQLTDESQRARARSALQALSEWDGRVSGDSAAASIFELFFAEVCQQACRIKAPRSWPFAAGKGVMRIIPGTTFHTRRAAFVVGLVREQPAGYFASWSVALLQALALAQGELWQRFGMQPSAAAWGKVRPVLLKHRFGEKKPLDLVFNGKALLGFGDGTTVNQAGFSFTAPLSSPSVTAHLRTIIDVGNFDASRFVLLGGQSGNPLSPNYTNLVPLWQQGKGVPVYWSDALAREHIVDTLTLEPS